MLIVKKVLNNSVLLAQDSNNKELLIRGKGIGYNVKPQQGINISNKSKIQYITNQREILDIFENIPKEYIEVGQQIVELAEDKLGITLNPLLQFSIADHIYGVKSRKNTDIAYNDFLQYEIPHLYHQEYEIAIESLVIVKKQLNFSIPESEASILTMHIVNAELQISDLNQTMELSSLVKEIVNLIQKKYNILVDKKSLTFSRFVTHLRYLLERHLNDVEYSKKMEISLKILETMSEMYRDSYRISVDVQKLLSDEFDIDLNNDELVYLIIHIQRLYDENVKS